MRPHIYRLALFASLLWGAACSHVSETHEANASPDASTVTTLTADNITIYGETYFGDLDAAAPLILLFHQGGANGRGEYAQIASWLNESGYRAIAWDQRRGGERLGETNRTVAGLNAAAEYSYCDAAPDLQAALDFARDNDLAEKVVVWGSSYSASLVFGLAADNSEEVAGVIAFSPAAGGPLVNCRARQWVDDVSAPIFVLRPASEMELDSSKAQRDILTAAGAKFMVVENGVHGSSMLSDARTQNDMSGARTAVKDWLDQVTGAADE